MSFSFPASFPSFFSHKLMSILILKAKILPEDLSYPVMNPHNHIA